MKRVSAHAAALVLLVAAHSSRAEVPSAYVSIAQSQHVPAKILYAVACAESGREMSDGQIRPWPWALNVAGQARFYSSRIAAYRDLTSELPSQPNIDIGLGQISWYWHRHRLVSAWLALDPYFNLKTAAQLLRAQFDRCHCNDWWIAVERYHAPSDSAIADRRRAEYRERVQRCSRTF
jgi:hypothetical protein